MSNVQKGIKSQDIGVAVGEEVEPKSRPPYPMHYVIFGSQNGAKNRENSLFNLIFLTILTYKAPIWDHKTTVQF